MLTEKQLKEEVHALFAEGGKEAYISAVLTFGGTLGKEEKGYYLSYSSHDYLLAWEFATYMRERYSYHAEVGIRDPDDKRRSRVYTVEIRGKYALRLLTDIGKIKVAGDLITSLDLGVSAKYVEEEDIAAYVRGVFLSVGSLTRAAEGLRLELTFELQEDAEAFRDLLEEIGVSLTLAEKGDKYSLSTRKMQTLADFCALMRASKSALALNETMLQKIVDGNTARAGNLLLANTEKSVTAAVRQYNDAITVKEGTGGFIGVPEEIAEVAEARINNPDVSIEQLAAILPGKITKSGLYHRLQKMREMAKSIREDKP